METMETMDVETTTPEEMPRGDLPFKPGVISVLVFNAGTLGPSRKAWKLRPDSAEDLDPAALASVPKDFCKRNPEGRQRRFRCNACNCVLESTDSLGEHVRGAKHKDKEGKFDPFASALPTPKAGVSLTKRWACNLPFCTNIA